MKLESHEAEKQCRRMPIKAKDNVSHQLFGNVK
jgi:hypothetical protein